MSTDQKGEGKGLSELKIDNNMCSSCLIFSQYNNYQCIYMFVDWFRFMVFNATFNNISIYCVRSVLLVEKTGVPGEACQEIEYFLLKL